MFVTRVKICGITRVEDALVTEDAGADAIGLNFVPNTKRFISLSRAQEISEALSPFMARVGVFRNASFETILEAVEQAGLNAVQLNGQESDDFAARVAGLRPVIRAVSFKPNLELPENDTLLIDGLDPGSGQSFDWAALKTVNLEGRRWLLAGGLNPDNVAAAVRQLQPWCVDVASGVEASPGIKDADLVRAFIENAKMALETQPQDLSTSYPQV
jgi:phosphoribosylanthranilate isomerase